MKILNLTQHKATTEQRDLGVVDLEGEVLHQLVECLTFDSCPDDVDISARVVGLVTIATCYQDLIGADAAMIGGAPWLMGPLAEALLHEGVQPLFAFSVRESEEVFQPDGSVRKVAVFRHKGWVAPRL